MPPKQHVFNKDLSKSIPTMGITVTGRISVSQGLHKLHLIQLHFSILYRKLSEKDKCNVYIQIYR